MHSGLGEVLVEDVSLYALFMSILVIVLFESLQMYVLCIDGLCL